ncbi:MAG: hypothetical protein ACLTDV_08405 [Eubacterium sp.]
MKKSYAVITGASSGIGRSIVKTACGRRIPSGTGCSDEETGCRHRRRN